MKRLFLFFIAIFSTITLLAQQEFVVQSSHSGQIINSALDSKRGVLVTYGLNDKTLKFWDEKSGLLYKTLDLLEGINKLQINEEKGVLYTLGQNIITTYSLKSFEKIKEIALGRIFDIQYSSLKGHGKLLFLAQDTNYMTALFALNEDDGTFESANIAPIPTDAEISHFEFTPNGKYIYIAPNYGDYYLYSIEKSEYLPLKGDYIAAFGNGDVLRGVYDNSANKAVYMRMNPTTRKVLWNKSFAIEKEIEGIFMPTIFDITKSKDGKKIWIKTGVFPVTQLNAQTGEIIGSFTQFQEAYSLIDNENYIYAQLGYDKPYGKYKLFNPEPVTKYGNTVVEPNQAIGFQNGEGIELLFSSQYGAKTYSLFAHPKVTQFTKYKTNYRDDFSDGKMLPDPSSDKVFVITSTFDPIKVFKRGKPDSFEDFIENSKNVRQYDFSPNTKLLATLSTNTLRVINTETKSEVFNKPLNIETSFFENCFSLSPFSNAIAYTSQEIQGDRIMYEQLHYFDFGSKTIKWSKDGKYFGIFHINGGKELLTTNATTNAIEIFDAKTGSLLRSIPTHFKNSMMDSFLSPNKDYLLYSGFQLGASVYHIPSGKKMQSFDVNNYGKLNGGFVTNTIIASAESGAIKFIDVLTAKEVLRLYIFEDESWVAYTPEGQFDGSQEGWDKVAFIKNKKTIPLESVFSQFYTPRLINQVLANKNFKSNINIESIAPPPSIVINYKQGTRNLYVDDDVDTEITVDSEIGKMFLTADPKGEKIEEIRLYQNGKLVGNNKRNLFVEDDVSQDPNKKEIDVKLMEGLNEFSAVAINTQGTESVPKKLNVTYTPSKQSLIKPQGIQAYLLIVGIDEYQNPKYNLNYAVADATGFKESLQKGLANITSKTHVYFIKNDEAIRKNILEKLTEIASVANPQDIFIFYYAGHGVMNQEGDKEFFIVPTDVTQLYGDDGALKQKGISASELKKVASGISAQKQLYILDACQSAGALTTIAARGASEEKAIAQLARSTGTHWLTASGSQQFATEFDELGHGVFTYALLEAISGKADSGDGRVTVNELKAYLETRVPEISEKYKGSPQYPSSFGFGQDFPVSIYK